jgi:FAD/FMN-containing dehydrogenase
MRASLAAGPDRDPGVARLQERVKAAFDPCGILNPGLDPAADL